MENAQETLLDNLADGRGKSPGSRRTQIRKGENRPAAAVGRALEPMPEPKPVFEDGVELSPLLVEFRKVYHGQVTERTPRKTPVQAAIIRMFARNFEKFLARYERLEMEFREQRDALKKPAETWLPPDEGEERVRRLLRELLDKAAGKPAASQAM